MTDLFDHAQEASWQRTAPLAVRMRPRTLEEFVGQKHLVGQGKVLHQAIARDELFSMILWGPPGCGKTTLAHLIAQQTKSAFVSLSAVAAGVRDLKRIIDDARNRLQLHHQRTIFFLDEIHRWNKAQQDALLPYVEDGTVVLIGATTENPSFEVIGPLLSRARVLLLERLMPAHLTALVQRALTDTERGLGSTGAAIEPDALAFLTAAANGDGRTALLGLELAAQIAGRSQPITRTHVAEALQRPALLYDKHGEEHYNVISAFIKSIRGSDADAGLYWLARMLEAGEDAQFIARRLVILASEDIGNADPQALVLATAVAHAAAFVGLPEAQLNLAQAVTYLARAPKSNASYVALLRAQEDVRATLNAPVPLHLRNAVTNLMAEAGYGKGYKYSHDFAEHPEEGKQQYRPDAVEGHTYYPWNDDRKEFKSEN